MYKLPKNIKRKRTVEYVASPYIDVGVSESTRCISDVFVFNKRRKQKPEKTIHDVLPDWFNPIEEMGIFEVKRTRVIFCSEVYGDIILRYDSYEGYIIADSSILEERLKRKLEEAGYYVVFMLSDLGRETHKLLIRESKLKDQIDREQYVGLEHLFQ